MACIHYYNLFSSIHRSWSAFQIHERRNNNLFILFRLTLVIRKIVRICRHGKSVSGALSTKQLYRETNRHAPGESNIKSRHLYSLWNNFSVICSPRFIFLLYEWAKWMTYLLLTINFPAVQQERLFVHESVFHADRNMSLMWLCWNIPREGIPGNSWWGCTARFTKSWPDFRPHTSR